MFRLMHVLMMFLSLQVTVAVASDVASSAEANRAPAPLPPAYPDWPDRPLNLEMVPPPPSGPYMSTGLNDAHKGFGCCQHKRQTKMMDTQEFAAMPWPKRRRPPQQWKPENGDYSFPPKGADQPERAPRFDRYRGYNTEPPWQPIYRQPPPYYYR